MAEYTLVSPDGHEHPTSDPAYRHKLLAQGYTDKPAGKTRATVPHQRPAATPEPKPSEEGPR